jgi:integrase
LAGPGSEPLPLGITPHKLRHTFASSLVAIGKDPTCVMQQLGHADPAFTLRVYSHMMRRSDEEREGSSRWWRAGLWQGISREHAFPPATGLPRTTCD